MTYGIGCVRPVAVIDLKFHFNKFKLKSVGRELNSLCLDLKAFERRLTEYIHCLQPATGRWRSKLPNAF